MGKMKRIFSLILVLTLVLGSFGAAFATDAAPDTELKKVPSDVIGTEFEKAVTKLVSFSVLNGYPDGTFKPENDVTRAEFAKILVEALGIGNAADAAVGTTKFPDVNTGGYNWASGYINVASGQGLLQGYPDGTFKPAEKVNYAEALTMLVRALGYRDSFLKGSWPGNYIAKAAEAGITSGVSFSDARGFANRGKVAQLVSNALDSKVVKVETYQDGEVKYYESEVTLMKDKLDISKYEDTRVIADKLVDDGLEKDEVTVKFLKEIKKNDESVKRSYDEGEERDFKIKNGVNSRKYIGEEVSVYMDDRDNVVYIESENDDRAYFDYVEDLKGKDGEVEEVSLVKFDKDYKFDKDAKVYVFNASDDQYEELDARDGYIDAEAKDLLGHVGKFVVKNNRIIYAEIMDSTEALPWMLVLENNKGLLEGINETTEDFDIDLTKDGNFDGVFVYDTDGNALDVSDIDEGNIIYVQKHDYDGDDYAVVVVVKDNVVEGELTKVKDDRVTIGGKQIKAVRYKDDGNQFQAYYSVEGFEDIKEWDNADRDDDMEDADEEDMVAYLDATGKIAFLSTEARGVSGYKYGVVTRAYADNDRVKIYTTIDGKSGDEITYRADKDRDLSSPRLLDELGNHKDSNGNDYGRTDLDNRKLEGHAVKFKLNKDGEIAEDEFYVMDPENSWKMQSGRDFGKDSIPSKSVSNDKNRSFSIDDKAVVMDAESLVVKDGKPSIGDSDDFRISNWKDIAEDNYDESLEYYVFTKRNNDIDIDAVIFIGEDGLSTSSDEEAVYVIDTWTKGGDVYVKYASYETGKVEEVEVDKVDKKGSVALIDVDKERPYVARIKSGNLIELFSNQSSIDDNLNKSDLSYVVGEVKDKNGNIITVDGREYRLASSAVVYEEDVKKSTSNIRKGDAVFFVVENKVNVRVIERLIDSEADKVLGNNKPSPSNKNEVTYINEEEGLIEVDGKVLELDTRVRLVDANGETITIGPKAVAAKLKKGQEVRLTEDKGIVTQIRLVEEKDDNNGNDNDNDNDNDDKELTGTIEPTMYGDVLEVKVSADSKVTKVVVGENTDPTWAIEDNILRIANVEKGDVVKVTIDEVEKTVKF